MRQNNRYTAAALAVALIGGGLVGLTGDPAPANYDDRKGLEGNIGKPYQDVGGVWTDCFGNTKNVRAGFVRSEAECRALLGGEADRISGVIDRNVGREIPPLTKAAFISFQYNVGDGAMLRSTLFRKAKAGDFAGACEELKKWVFVKGKFSRGIANRRGVEYAVCVSGLQKE